MTLKNGLQTVGPARNISVKSAFKGNCTHRGSIDGVSERQVDVRRDAFQAVDNVFRTSGVVDPHPLPERVVGGDRFVCGGTDGGVGPNGAWESGDGSPE